MVNRTRSYDLKPHGNWAPTKHRRFTELKLMDKGVILKIFTIIVRKYLTHYIIVNIRLTYFGSKLSCPI